MLLVRSAAPAINISAPDMDVSVYRFSPWNMKAFLTGNIVKNLKKDAHSG
jgi:hypothetical protein